MLFGEPFRDESGITRMASVETSDDEVRRRAQTGDPAAFRRIAELHSGPLTACAFSLCRDRHFAEDLVQETLVEAWRSLSRFDGRCRFSTWLYGILRNRYMKAIRRHAISVKCHQDAISPETFAKGGPTPACAAERSEDALRVRNAVAGLVDEHRLVVELRFFVGATLDEIAAIVGCPLGTVKSRLHHGLEKLRQMNLAMNHFQQYRESESRKP